MTQLFDLKTCGSACATQVEVRAPQGSSFDGRRGVVARLVGDTAFVRFPSGLELPFHEGELRPLFPNWKPAPR